MNIQEHTISGAANKMKEGAQEMKEAVKETAATTMNEYCEQTAAMIRDNPFSSLAIAFGAGALLGIFFLRRS